MNIRLLTIPLSECLSWFGVSWTMPNNVKTLFDSWLAVGFFGTLKKFWISAFFAVLWSIWRTRNKIIFEKGVFKEVELVEQIRYFGKTWSAGYVHQNLWNQHLSAGYTTNGQQARSRNSRAASQSYKGEAKKIWWLCIEYMQERNLYAIGGTCRISSNIL